MYFIDAHSGDVVLQFSDLKTQRGQFAVRQLRCW